MLNIKTLATYAEHKPFVKTTSISFEEGKVGKAITHFHVHTQHDTFSKELMHVSQYASKDSISFKRTHFEIEKITEEFTPVKLGKISGFVVTTITIHFTDGSFQEHCFW